MKKNNIDPNAFIAAAEAVVGVSDDPKLFGENFVCNALAVFNGDHYADHSSPENRFFTEWFKPWLLPVDHETNGWWGDPLTYEELTTDPKRFARSFACLLCIELLKDGHE